MTEQERKEILNLASTLEGEINRMCVTKQLAEFESMHVYAKKNLDKLFVMILQTRFKEYIKK